MCQYQRPLFVTAATWFINKITLVSIDLNFIRFIIHFILTKLENPTINLVKLFGDFKNDFIKVFALLWDVADLVKRNI